MKKFIIIAAAALMTTGCGGAYRNPASNSTSTNWASSGGNSTDTGGNGSSTDPVTTVENFNPSYTDSFEVSGAGGTEPTATLSGIYTDTELKVRVTAGPAGNLALPSNINSGYSNYSGQYYCVKYNVTALGMTKTTSALSVGGGSTVCPDAPSSQVLDFSGRLAPGHGAVSVTVQAAGYDYYCGLLMSGLIPGAYYNWSYYQNLYCSPSLYSVYKTHTVTGSLDIEVNGSGI